MDKQRKYCGVGSRQTPSNILCLMTDIAKELASKGWLLRSGGADGADTAFELGADQLNGAKEIFLPWPYFNKNKSQLHTVPDKAIEIAAEIHPAWNKLSRGAKLLHGRNVMQVLGETLDDPVEVLVCWTPYGRSVGGTRTAIILAEQHKVKIVNLYYKQWSYNAILGD
jgi:hypothetical protein